MKNRNFALSIIQARWAVIIEEQFPTARKSDGFSIVIATCFFFVFLIRLRDLYVSLKLMTPMRTEMSSYFLPFLIINSLIIFNDF